MGAGKKVYTYVDFSPQNVSNFLALKIFQIHCYYRISQKQSNSKVIFQTLICNEGVGYRWRENGHFKWSA